VTTSDLDRLPVSIKGVVFDLDGQVLLGRNDRDEWELLGGRIQAGEHPRATLRREIHEESGLYVEVEARPVESTLFDVFANGQHVVFVVAYRCYTGKPAAELRLSDEHTALQWFTLQEAHSLDDLPGTYKRCLDQSPATSEAGWS